MVPEVPRTSLDHVSSVIRNEPGGIRNELGMVTLVPISALVVDGSPRSAGADSGHIRLLAELSGTLPPITVHRPTMRVIDGMHRVRAAMLNGRSEIEARLLDCDENVAFVLAVKANVTHGLPLSQADRAAAAERIILDNPQWSDRAVAAAAGLSDKTVSRIRASSSAERPQSEQPARPGRPAPPAGRRHPAAAGRRDDPRPAGGGAARGRPGHRPVRCHGP
jgi:hypothetical protein